MVPGDDAILSHLRRGALEYCVLALLRDGEAYGLDIGARLGGDGVLLGGEGTLYPLLSRLRRQGLVETSWRESTAGPPRRYYSLTVEGSQALDRFTSVWRRYRDAVDSALKGSL